MDNLLVFLDSIVAALDISVPALEVLKDQGKQAWLKDWLLIGIIPSPAISIVGASSLPKVLATEDSKAWLQQMSLLWTFQYILNQCWAIGALGVFFAGTGDVFFNCMYEFTYNVDWYVPPHKTPHLVGY